jgi:predicted ATPase
MDLLYVAVRGGLSDYVQSQGGIIALIWDGQAERISCDITLDLSRHFSRLAYVVYQLDLLPTGLRSSYSVSEESLVDDEVTHLTRTSNSARVISDAKNFDKDRGINADSVKSEETVISLLSPPFVENMTILTTKYIIGNWRTFQDVETHRKADMRLSPVTRLEERLSTDAQNLINVLNTLYVTDREFERSINEAMAAAFGNDFDKLIFPPAADQRIQLRIRWKSLKRETSAADLSDGTMRFLFLITALAAPKLPPVIAIDEPETGLHPSMFPIIAEYAAEASKRAQIIFTTHSDQFLDACSRFQPTVTVTKWQDGETVLRTIAGDELERWLKQYTLGALYRSGELESELVG